MLLVPAGARAAPLPEDVKALYGQANAEYEHREYKAALADFEQVYALHHLPGLLFNIAQCHRQLGEIKEAAAAYRSFIGRDPKNKHIEQARGFLDQLEALLAKQEDAQLKAPPEAPPPRAEEGTSGPPGQADTIASESLRLVEPTRAVVGVSSDQTTKSVASPDAPPAPRSAIAVADQSFAEGPAPLVHRTRVWTWVAAGCAGVATGIALGLGAKSNSIKSSLADSAHPGAEVQSLQADQVSDAHRANSFYVAGGALGAIAITLFALDY